MTEYVDLYLKRNRGWPWPEESSGLAPMFGADGWCHKCFVPLRDQSGAMVLERKGFKTVQGAWTPYWRYGYICLARELAGELADDFDLEFRDVEWRGKAPGEACQLVIPVVGDSWFDEAELRNAEAERGRSVAGRTCPACGTWRWMPLTFGYLPPLRVSPGLDGVPIAASPEWFGDARKSFRELVIRADLAERIASASPRDFRVEPIAIG